MSLKIFREDYKGEGMNAEVARFMNRVGKFLNNLRAVSNLSIQENHAGGLDFDAVGVIEVSGSVAADERWSFRCTLDTRDPVAPETEPVAVVKVTPGYKQIIGSAPVSVGSAQFDVANLNIGGSVYAVWTYTTHDAAGAWSDPFWAFGTPPAEDATKRVVVLAIVLGGQLTHRHLGDVVVLDIADRTDCV